MIDWILQFTIDEYVIHCYQRSQKMLVDIGHHFYFMIKAAAA